MLSFSIIIINIFPQIELERLQLELTRTTKELHKQMREKEGLLSEEEKLRKYSMKQQTLIHELRRKLAMFSTDLKTDFSKGKLRSSILKLLNLLKQINFNF